jgi:hypothetical protein
MRRGCTMRSASKLCKIVMVLAAVAASSVVAAQGQSLDNFIELISEWEAGEMLAPAMYALAEPDAQDLRDRFMNDPREYLLGQGVDLPASDYFVMALDITALQERTDAFAESPLQEGLLAMPFSLTWSTAQAIIMLQPAAPGDRGETDGSVRYATVEASGPPAQDYLRIVVGISDAVLTGLRQIIVEVTTDDEARAEAVEVGLREFAARRGLELESDRYALQIVDLAALRDAADPKLNRGEGFSISAGEGTKVLEGLGIVYIDADPDGFSFAVSFSGTF